MRRRSVAGRLLPHLHSKRDFTAPNLLQPLVHSYGNRWRQSLRPQSPGNAFVIGWAPQLVYQDSRRRRSSVG